MPDIHPTLEDESLETGRWIGWTFFGAIVLGGFIFGVVTGNMRPREVVKEVVKNVPVETKPEAKPEKKKEPPREVVVVRNPEPTNPTIPPETEPPPPKNGLVTEAIPEIKPKTDPKPLPKTQPKPEVKIAQVTFDKEIKPIFVSKCNNCHGAIGKPKAGLDLRTLAAIMKGSENGDALKSGDLDKSLIWTNIKDEAMPPPDKTQLTDKEKELIKNWILSGGK